MTALFERSRSKGSSGSALPMTLPQVNLLPPEVRAARGLRATKRWLALSLVLVLALCVGGYGLALVAASFADKELAEVQDETARLQAEQAQYSRVPQVLAALEQTRTARQVGMATDVQWKTYLDAITAVLPEKVSIDTFNVTVATPMTLPAGPSNPLQASGIGEVVFTGRTSTLPDTAAWVDALESVPGFASAWVTSVAVTSDDGGIYYNVSSSVVVTEAVLSHRFDDVVEGS